MNKEEKNVLREQFLELAKVCFENEVFDVDKDRIILMHAERGAESTEMILAMGGRKNDLASMVKKAINAGGGEFKSVIMRALMMDAFGGEDEEDDCDCPKCQFRRGEITEEQYDIEKMLQDILDDKHKN